MDTLNQLINVLKLLIRAGIIMRVVFCFISMNLNNDEQGVQENKTKIKKALIFLILSECVWVIKDIVSGYYLGTPV